MQLWSCFLISIKLKVFRVAKNEIPKMEKLSVSTNRLSHYFAEHIRLYSASACHYLPVHFEDTIVRVVGLNCDVSFFAYNSNDSFPFMVSLAVSDCCK